MILAKLRLFAIALALVYSLLVYSLLAGPAYALGGAAKLRPLSIGWPGPRRARVHEKRRLVPTSTLGLRVGQYARKFLGVPYRWGGESPTSGFDCSGLVRFVYAHFGLRLPHSSYSDFALGVGVPRRALLPGDLVFFDGLGHVGIYVGENRFIHGPHSGGRVQIMSLATPWYRSAYDGARRLLGRVGAKIGRG